MIPTTSLAAVDVYIGGVLFLFSAVVPQNTEEFTNEEKNKLYWECHSFCIKEVKAAGTKLTDCAQVIMDAAILSTFTFGRQILPELHNFTLIDKLY